MGRPWGSWWGRRNEMGQTVGAAGTITTVMRWRRRRGNTKESSYDGARDNGQETSCTSSLDSGDLRPRWAVPFYGFGRVI